MGVNSGTRFKVLPLVLLNSSPKFGAECLSLRAFGQALESGKRFRPSNMIKALGVGLGLGFQL